MNTSLTPQEKKQKRDEYFQELTRLDTHINDEYQWIGQRLTWLLTSNSFLLLSFITAISVASFWNHNPISDPKFELLFNIYFRGLPGIGLASCFFVFIGVIAAQIVVYRHRSRRDTVEENAKTDVGLESVANKTLGWLNIVGMSAGLVMPVCLFILWGYIEYAVCTGQVL